MRRALLINDTSNEKHIGCNAVVSNIKRECRKNNIEIVATRTREDIYTLDKSKIYESNIDLVIINGEGTFHHNQKLARDLTKVLSFFDGVEKVLINSTWFKMDRSLKHGLLDHMKVISVREKISHEEIKQIYPEALKVPDAIFLTEFKRNTIGYGDSVRSDVTKVLSCGENYNPMCFEVNMPTVQSYLCWLSSQEVHITGRFHGVCLSCIAGVPFLAIKSNCPKIQSMLQDIGCPELMINGLSDLSDEKIKKAKEALPKIIEYTKKAREANQELFRRL